MFIKNLATTILGLLLLSANTAAQTSSGAETGSVKRIVLDVDQKPVPEANVEAKEEQNMLQNSNVKTDSQSRFVFERLPTGFAYLYAWKEADGYPYVAFSFNLEPSMTLPRIEVKPGETVDGVVIQVGEKPAYLTIEATDEDGKPLNADIDCYRPDQGDHGDYSRSMHFKETIPVPIVPFSLAMNEKGYEPWHYGQDPGQSKDGLIKLKSGETLTLQVKLKREQ